MAGGDNDVVSSNDAFDAFGIDVLTDFLADFFDGFFAEVLPGDLTALRPARFFFELFTLDVLAPDVLLVFLPDFFVAVVFFVDFFAIFLEAVFFAFFALAFLAFFAIETS